MLNTAVQQLALAQNPISVFLLSVGFDVNFILNFNFECCCNAKRGMREFPAEPQWVLDKTPVKSLRDISVSKLWELLLMNSQNMRIYIASDMISLFGISTSPNLPASAISAKTPLQQ